MPTDPLSTILTVINTVNKISDKLEERERKKAPVEVVDSRPVIVQNPSNDKPTPPINVNLTINIYKGDDDLPLLTSKKDGIDINLK